MSSSAPARDERVVDVRSTDDELIVRFADGSGVSLPLKWYPRLLAASPAARANWRLVGDGAAIHWPEVDEDLSAEGLARRQPSMERRRANA